MNKSRFSLLFLSILSVFLLSLSACKKINESTELGYDLIPPIDGVNTFDTSLSIISDNFLFNDSTETDFADDLAIGTITNDPEFGTTRADAYITLRPIVYGGVPFLTRVMDSLTVDSVVLQLAYKGAFGDTMTPLTYTVQEVDDNSDFHDTAFYRYSHPDFALEPLVLGSKTFSISQVNDSIPVIRPRDTTKVANVVRITLNNYLGTRLMSFDTTGYKDDSTFKERFKGLAIKSDPGTGNALAYFSANDVNTKLTVYYKARINGVDSSSRAEFVHIYVAPQTEVKRTAPVNFRHGQANLIKRTNSGNYAAYLANGNPSDDQVYIRTAPGSYATLKVPGLSGLPNAVVHRAELIVYKIPSALDNIFTPPARLFLDKINDAGDSAYVFHKDLYNNSGALQFNVFGGTPDANGIYKFNISRHVQDVLTRKDPNYAIRIYAPMRTRLYFPPITGQKTPFEYQVLTQPANGRVVLAGGNYPDASRRMRLRIIYSKI